MNSNARQTYFTALCWFLMIALALPVLHGAESDPPKKTEPTGVAPMKSGLETKLEDMTVEIQTLQHEVDALQIEMAKENRPWYLDAATIIAILALIFSFGTTWVSNRKADAQDIENQRSELRSLLQRMAELPKENLDATDKYRLNAGALSTVSGYINQENTFLSVQAAEIATKLPPEKVSAVEYYAIALGLGNAYDPKGQKTFLELAIKHATDFNTTIAAVRSNANALFQAGDAPAGRTEYQKALAIFDKYTGYDEYTKTSTHIKTELNWAFSEAVIHVASPLSGQHLDQADVLLTALWPSPGRTQLDGDINQARLLLGFPRFHPEGKMELNTSGL